jgi:hypothetical protein
MGGSCTQIMPPIDLTKQSRRKTTEIMIALHHDFSYVSEFKTFSRLARKFGRPGRTPIH